jgi:hypothetical protein
LIKTMLRLRERRAIARRLPSEFKATWRSEIP